MLSDIRLLYVEDDEDIAEEVSFFLKRRVKELHVAKDGQEGMELFVKYRPDVVVTDIQMPKMNGLEMIAKIREINTEVPVIITSAYNDIDFLSHSIELGVNGYITKPINLSHMLESIKKAYEPQKLHKEIRKKNIELQTINTNLDAIIKDRTKDLEYLYYHDKLTSLENKIALQEKINNHDFEYLILLDIANFSYLNKQYGVEFSDKVLFEASKLLKAHCTPDIHLYKIESDRFVFLLNEVNTIKAEEFCQQIHSFFDTRKIEIDNIFIGISFNIGVVSSNSKEKVMVHAEYALDIAKELSARNYSFYDETNEVVKKNKNLIKWLNITKQMIESNNIIPYFQPIFNAKEHKIAKFEVLARGIYNGEIISPFYFIEPATKLGLISSITKIMIQKSFQFFKDNSFEFSINISEKDLYENYLYNHLQERMSYYGIEASRITLEILENITTTNHHLDIVEQINKLKSLGLKIAIDDFGTENANFSRLMHINFDYLKLDGIFIRNLNKNETQQIIVKSVVQLAKVLGVQTVAEFVENREVYEKAKECGIDFMQGYYFGKPCKELHDDITPL